MVRCVCEFPTAPRPLSSSSFLSCTVCVWLRSSGMGSVPFQHLAHWELHQSFVVVVVDDEFTPCLLLDMHQRVPWRRMSARKRTRGNNRPSSNMAYPRLDNTKCLPSPIVVLRLLRGRCYYHHFRSSYRTLYFEIYKRIRTYKGAWAIMPWIRLGLCILAQRFSGAARKPRPLAKETNEAAATASSCSWWWWWWWWLF